MKAHPESWQEAAVAAERIAVAELPEVGYSILQVVAGGKKGQLQLGNS